MLNLYFYLFLIINAGVQSEVLPEDSNGEGYDSIFSLPLASLFKPTGAFPLQVLPDTDPALKEDVIFLCVKPNGTTFRQAYVNDTNISEKLDTSKPVAIFTHGWTDAFNYSLFLVKDGKGWMSRLAPIWAQYGDTNVCAVDWSQLSRYIYSAAAYNIRAVGRYIGVFVESLVKNNGFNLDQFTISGHSMGGQICGFAGAYLKSRGLSARRIIALDPAGPLFTYPILADPADRLDESDGDFVMVIHTSTIIGAYVKSGHADYYVNGGIHQTGCTTRFLQSGLPKTRTICDHYRAVEFFMSSLNPNNKFVGSTCWPGTNSTTNCTTDLMGIYNNGVSGKFWLETTANAPFCVGCA